MFGKNNIFVARVGLVLSILIGISGCNNKDEPGIQDAFDNMSLDSDTTTANGKDSLIMDSAAQKLPSEAQYLDSLGLVNVQELDSSIQVRLRYSSTDNFLNTDLYGDLEQAYLQPDVADKLVKASAYLQDTLPNLRLLVWDAVRPVSVQKRMWEVCDVPLKRRHWYVTPPEKRSLHNYGAAVDVCLVDTSGNALDMGTDFDHFGEAAYTNREKELVETMLVSKEAVKNRQVLYEVMLKAGFTGIKYEWWHFDACSRATAESKYELIMSLGDVKNDKEW
ncbi:MAG: M15 family metallopeptidase [Bacteroidales bacterium]